MARRQWRGRVEVLLMTVMRVKSRVQRCLNSKYYFAPLGVTTEWLAGWEAGGCKALNSAHFHFILPSPFTPAPRAVRPAVSNQ